MTRKQNQDNRKNLLTKSKNLLFAFSMPISTQIKPLINPLIRTQGVRFYPLEKLDEKRFYPLEKPDEKKFYSLEKPDEIPTQSSVFSIISTFPFFALTALIVLALPFVIILDAPLVSSTTISSCTTLSSAGYYELTQDVSSYNTCMNITSNNVELDCKGFAIAYASAGVNTRIGIDATDGSTSHNTLTLIKYNIYQ